MIAVAPKEGSVFTREALGAVEELTEAAWRVPWSTRVDSLTNYYHSEAVGDDLNVERLVDDAGSPMTAIAFGTVVDDTIHFMTKYLKAHRDEGLSASEAGQYAFRSVGRALFTTTMILVLGFLVFASSRFVISWMLDLLVVLTIGFALICDFLLLPPLLIAIDRKAQ